MTSIFVAKLDFNVSDEELRQLFAQYGTVTKSHIAKDKETGKPRGFAFVEMSSDEEAQNAIDALNGYTINGRSMVVKEAEDRGSKPSGPPRHKSKPEQKEEYKERNANSEPFFSGDSLPDLQDTTKSKRGKNSKKKKGDGSSESRKTKMTAYKKSGKKNRIQFDDDDDWELELRKNKRGYDDDDY